MARASKEPDAYIIDTCKLPEKGTYIPGAITFCGRKKMEILQWKDHEFSTQEEADAFVRTHFAASGLTEAGNEGDLVKASGSW